MSRALSESISPMGPYNQHKCTRKLFRFSLKWLLISLPTLLQMSLICLPTAMGQSDDLCETLPKNETCAGGSGICRELQHCSTKDSAEITHSDFCNAACGIVCCPKPKPAVVIERRISGPHYDTYAAKACARYHAQVKWPCTDSYIYGGTKAALGEFPAAALLGCRNTTNGQTRWVCGGTLISERFVLTAAHCWRVASCEVNVVRLGELDYATMGDFSDSHDFAINSIPHMNYEEAYNDIALIELERNVTFTRHIFPACLPAPDAIYRNFIVIGWGLTESGKYSSHLLKAELQLIEGPACTESEVVLGMGEGLRERTQFCAGSNKTGVDTCFGDSGGPLLALHPNYGCMHVVAGIVSKGSVNCGVNEPSVNTKLNHYLDWIERVVWKIAARR